MTAAARVYLDHAATSWPKPEAVYAAVERYQRELGAPAGRGSYAEALAVRRLVDGARSNVARLLNAPDARQVIFAASGTDALHLAIEGLLGARSPEHKPTHVVTTVIEHNSVLRPLRRLANYGQITVTYVGCDSTGVVDPNDVRAALRPDTRLVAISHASNVTGAIQPIAEIAAIARERGILTLLDAAQTLGELPLDVARLGVDLLAAPGHKGLLGPLGTGLLYLRPGIEPLVECVRPGGTGSRSQDDRQPDELPDKYEAGNLNVPGIVGLGAGCGYLIGQTVARLRSTTIARTDQLLQGLRQIAGVRICGPVAAEARVGIVSLTVAGQDPQELAVGLDATYRVQARAGLHCAPLAHRALGTEQDGGTLRLSVGPFTTVEEIETALTAVHALASL